MIFVRASIIWLQLATAVATFLAAAVAVWQAHRTKKAVHEVHLSLNSRLDRMLTNSATIAHAKGVKEGKEEGKET